MRRSFAITEAIAKCMLQFAGGLLSRTATVIICLPYTTGTINIPSMIDVSVKSPPQAKILIL